MDTLSQLSIQHAAPHPGNQIRRRIQAQGPAGFARMMEQVFLQQMLKEMNTSLVSGGLFGDSNQARMYQGLFLEAFADQVAQSGGIGLADVLEDQLQQKYAHLFSGQKSDAAVSQEPIRTINTQTYLEAFTTQEHQLHEHTEVKTEGDTKDE